MKYKFYLSIIATLFLLSCASKRDQLNLGEDNQDLIKMTVKDQEIRLQNLENLEVIDKEQRSKIMEFLANGKIITNKDKQNAALTLQHNNLIYCYDKQTRISNENYLLAYMLSKSAFENGSKEAAYYVAITYDRYLQYTKGYQKYGTQRLIGEKTEKELWATIDPNTTDDERAKYNVPTLKDLLKHYNMQNLN